MVGQVIGMICSILCGIPFLVISRVEAFKNKPINFWSGDNSLNEKVKNIDKYNKEMGILYTLYGLVFIIGGILFLFFPLVALIIIISNSTLGILIVYLVYKSIIKKYS